MNGLYAGIGLDELADPQVIRSLQKALDTNGVTDEANLTGGSSFRVQSLDNLMQNTTFGQKNIQFYPSLKVRPVIGILDQYVVQSAYGNGRNFAPQGMNPVATTGTYKRRTLDIKFALTYRSLTHVLSTMDATGGNIVNAKAAEQKAGALDIAASLERACFFGDSAVIPEEFDGLSTWAANNGDARTVQDLHGTALNSLDPFFKAAGIMGSVAGDLTNFYMDTYSKMDFDKAFQTAMRFGEGRGDEGLTFGRKITHLETSFGTPKIQGNLFLNPERGFINPEDETNTDPIYMASSSSRGGDANNAVPAAPTGLTVTATGADGIAANMPAGDYYVTATSINYKGESACFAPVLVSGLTAGQRMVWTITSSDTTITGFRLFKSAVNGVDHDMRYFASVARTSGSVTYNDLGADVPGTCTAFGVDQTPEIGGVDFDQLLGLTSLQLAIVSPNMPWLQLLYGALRVTKPKRIQVIKNILPTELRALGWNPLGAA